MSFYAWSIPKARIGITLFFVWFTVPAWGYIAFWTLVQFIGAIEQIGGMSYVSALAHIGGLVVGTIFGYMYKFKKPKLA